ncbi:hypothetical protein [Hydrogenophaga sp. T2]|uniref:hypothetical protein n=1 Tax=Hydrogenophaga sp. T2 TaxID=3132823 RepID=UPI003CEBCCC6
MPIHLYTNKNPHIPTRDLPGGMPAKLVRGAKDVLQHGLRVGKAVALLPRHLKQQIFNGGPKRWIDPSRKQARKTIQANRRQSSTKIADLRAMVQRIEFDRLEAHAKAAGSTAQVSANQAFLAAAANLRELANDATEVRSLSRPADVAAKARLDAELLANADRIERAHAMPRTVDAVSLHEATLDPAALESNARSVKQALDAYADGLRGYAADEALTEQDFHAVTLRVLENMRHKGMLGDEHIQLFQAHCQSRASAPDAKDRFNPALPPLLEQFPLIRANVGKAWLSLGLLDLGDGVHLDADMLEREGAAFDNLFTQQAIEAWYAMPLTANKA